MPNHLSIQIRDQIATVIAPAVTTVATSRVYNFQPDELPAANILVGSSDIAEQIGRDQNVSQDFIIQVTIKGIDDVDRDIINLCRDILHSLSDDPHLSNTVHDSWPLSISEPVKSEADQIICTCEIRYTTRYCTAYNDLNNLL